MRRFHAAITSRRMRDQAAMIEAIYLAITSDTLPDVLAGLRRGQP
jgi:hypothetical protein